MKVSPKIVAAIAAALTISGSAATWWIFKTKAEAQRLTAEAEVYRSRAEQGDSQAERTLGTLYYHGQGVSQDYGKALVWYQKAADQGDPKAEYDLAYMYEFGLGSRLNYAEALKWYKKAANQNEASANVGLGSMYYYGRESNAIPSKLPSGTAKQPTEVCPLPSTRLVTCTNMGTVWRKTDPKPTCGIARPPSEAVYQHSALSNGVASAKSPACNARIFSNLPVVGTRKVPQSEPTAARTSKRKTKTPHLAGAPL